MEAFGEQKGIEDGVHMYVDRKTKGTKTKSTTGGPGGTEQSCLQLRTVAQQCIMKPYTQQGACFAMNTKKKKSTQKIHLFHGRNVVPSRRSNREERGVQPVPSEERERGGEVERSRLQPENEPFRSHHVASALRSRRIRPNDWEEGGSVGRGGGGGGSGQKRFRT